MVNRKIFTNMFKELFYNQIPKNGVVILEAIFYQYAENGLDTDDMQKIIDSSKFKGVIEYFSGGGEVLELRNGKTAVGYSAETVREMLEVKPIYNSHIQSPIKANSRIVNLIRKDKVDFVGDEFEGKHFKLNPFGEKTKADEKEIFTTKIENKLIDAIKADNPNTELQELANNYFELKILSCMEKVVFDAVNAVMFEKTGGFKTDKTVAIKPIYLFREITGKTPKNGLTKKQEDWLINAFMTLTERHIEITTPGGFKYEGALIQGDYIKNPYVEELKDGVLEVHYSVLADYSKQKKQLYTQPKRLKLLGMLAVGRDSDNKIKIRNYILDKFYLKTETNEFKINIDEMLQQCEIEIKSAHTRTRTADYVGQCLQVLKDNGSIKKFTQKTFNTKYGTHGIKEFIVEK